MRKTGRRPGLATAEASPRQSCSDASETVWRALLSTSATHCGCQHSRPRYRAPPRQLSEGLTPPAAQEKPPGPFGVAAALQAFTSSNFRDLPASPSVRGAGTYEQPGAIRRNALEG